MLSHNSSRSREDGWGSWRTQPLNLKSLRSILRHDNDAAIAGAALEGFGLGVVGVAPGKAIEIAAAAVTTKQIVNSARQFNLRTLTGLGRAVTVGRLGLSLGTRRDGQAALAS
jgi:hypothetical protein